MKLYIKQKVFSWNEKFTVKDENGNDKYFVEGEFLSLGRKLHVSDASGKEVAYIAQKLLTLLPKFEVYINGEKVAEIVKEFTFLRAKYTIEGLGWEVDGDYWSHDYEITKGSVPIVSIQKEWMTWGDSYELDIVDSQDEKIALAVVLAIDCVLAMQSN